MELSLKHAIKGILIGQSKTIIVKGVTVLDIIKRYIGKTVLFDQQHYQLIEVLNNGEQLVFYGEAQHIQSNMHGGARRRVNKHYQIALQSELKPLRLHPICQVLFTQEDQIELLQHLEQRQ